MSGSHRFDLVVLGGGPGGYLAALDGAEAGLTTALVERDLMGGTCLNRGCIPTKLMLGATSALEEHAAQARMRIASGHPAVDWTALQTKKDRLLAASRKSMLQRLQEAGVAVFPGCGVLEGPDKLAVTSENDSALLEFDNMVLATGCRPASFPGIEPDNAHVLDSTDFLELETVPESLIVVGAGFIGLEMAQIAHRMDASITLVDAMDRIAPLEDPEVSAALQAIFKRWKWTIRLGERVSSLKSEESGVRLALKSGEEFTAAKGLVAVGRVPATSGLGLDRAGITTVGPGFVAVDEHLRATDRIYAVGDVNGRIQLAHAAAHQAGYVVDRITGRTDKPYAPGPVPSILYGSPEVMRVGFMAEELAASGKTPLATRVPLAANPMAQAHAAAQGFVKVVWDPSSGENRVAGVTAVGWNVSSLTVAATIMVQEQWTRDQARDTIFPHPTLDESLKEALTAKPEPA